MNQLLIILCSLHLFFGISSLSARDDYQEFLSQKECLFLKSIDPKILNHLNSLEATIKGLQERCPFVEKNRDNSGSLPLSKYWAQEYSGIDLVRTELTDVKLPSGFISIIDDGWQEHAQQVSHLIASPHPSALFTRRRALSYIQHREKKKNDDQVFRETYAHCINKGSCPQFISMSYGWVKGENMREPVSKVLKRGTVITTSAGNEGENSFVEKSKEVSAREDNLILVGNANFDGNNQFMSSPSPEIAIAAPADYRITSFNDRGVAKEFGGTSAAQPLVNATLAAFQLESGLNLDGALAKELLKNSALPWPNYPKKSSVGPGLLNSYKILKVAKKIKQKCGTDQDCLRESLTDKKTYQFENTNKKNKVLKEVQNVFPQCFGNRELKKEYSCKFQRGLFSAVRKLTFESPNDHRMWELLSCLHKVNGLEENAFFYSNMANGLKLNDEEKVKKIKENNPLGFIKNVLSHPYWMEKEADTIRAYLKSGKYSKAIKSFIFSREGSERFKPELLKKIEDQSTPYGILDMIKAAHWSQHPEVLMAYVKKIKALPSRKRDYFQTSFGELLRTPEWETKIRELLKEKTGEDTAPTFSNVAKYL